MIASGWPLILCAALLWGTTGTAQTLAPTSATPAAIGALRLIVGGSGLLVVAVLTRQALSVKGLPVVPLLLAALAMAVFQVCFFESVRRTGVAIGTLVTIGSAPMVAGLLAWVVGRRGPGRRWEVATALAIAGCALLVLAPMLSAAQAGGVGDLSDSLQLMGVGMGVASGSGYALFVAASKRLVAVGAPVTVMAIVFCLAGLLLSPVLIGADLGWIVTPVGLGVLAHIGLVTNGGAYWLFARGLQHTAAPTATTLTLAEPLTATILGILVVGERLTVWSGLGAGLLLMGLLVVATDRGRRT
ncbi:MAG: DMT family transporter [Chloroflexota bacterium]